MDAVVDIEAAIEASKLYIKAQDELSASVRWLEHSQAAGLVSLLVSFLVSVEWIFMTWAALLVLSVACAARWNWHERKADRYLDLAMARHREACGE